MQWQNFICEYEEVYSEVSFAVANALKCFDPKRETRFSSYAIEAIKHKMADFRHKLIQYRSRFISL